MHTHTHTHTHTHSKSDGEVARAEMLVSRDHPHRLLMSLHTSLWALTKYKTRESFKKYTYEVC